MGGSSPESLNWPRCPDLRLSLCRESAASNPLDLHDSQVVSKE